MTLGYALFCVFAGFVAGLACWGYASFLQNWHDR